MTKPFQIAMREAAKLTRNGQLGEATDVIREMLGAIPARVIPRGRKVSPSQPFDLLRPSEDETVARRRPAPDASGGSAEFASKSYRSSEGEIGYKLYRPAGIGSRSPLVVMLHGCTQTPDDFAIGTGMNRLADELGLTVAYPAQSHVANAQRCWNWFKPGDQRRGGGEPALIAGLTAEIIAQHSCDSDRVYVAGLSAGGAAAAILGNAYPDIYAAIGVHSGLACGAAHDLPSALTAMNRGAGAALRQPASFVPTIIFHGDKDRTVVKANARDLASQAAAGAPQDLTERIEEGRSANGKSYTRAISTGRDGKILIEQWSIHGAGHAWSGGHSAGSFTDPAGPDASREMCRFFLEHRLR